MHLGMYVCSQGIEPTTFSAANVMLYHWDTGTWPLKLLTWVKVHPKMEIAANLVYFFCWEQFSTLGWEPKVVGSRLPVTKQLMVAIYFNYSMERNIWG